MEYYFNSKILILIILMLTSLRNYNCLLRSSILKQKRILKSIVLVPKLLSTDSYSSNDKNINDYTSPFYITTPIYYVNGDPHLGHAYTSVVSDIIARFWRLDGRDVYFLTGTDEHGQKVEQSAMKLNSQSLPTNINSMEITQNFVDKMSNKFRLLSDKLNLSNDDFIRTTEDRHKQTVRNIWKTLEENNHIYLGSYEGWYSIRDEAFYSETELVNGKAPTGAEVEWVKEESYFFRLSAFTNRLLEYYDTNPDFIYPKGRRNEVISFVSQEGGLKDLSISRTTFQWGISVPNDSKHVIYVWLDALTNYLSALGYPNYNSDLEKFWPASLHIVGKDILRFHAIYWPAFLMGANIELPKRIFAHGWWTREGEKMSKSIGNVIDPFDLVEKYGVDNLRYFLIAEVNFGNDGDFTDEAIIQRINSDLANDIGNLYQRVLIFISKHCDNFIPKPDKNCYASEDIDLLNYSKKIISDLRESVYQQNMKQYTEYINQIARSGNKYIDTMAPWTLVKDPNNLNRLNTVLYVLSELCRQIGILLQPIIPETSSLMLDQLGIPTEKRAFSHLLNELIEPGSKIGIPKPIFKKFDKEIKNDSNMNKPKNNNNKDNNELINSFAKLSIDELTDNIVKISEEIRQMKNSKMDKKDIKQKVDILLALKECYKKANNGIEYGPVKV